MRFTVNKKNIKFFPKNKKNLLKLSINCREILSFVSLNQVEINVMLKQIICQNAWRNLIYSFDDYYCELKNLKIMKTNNKIRHFLCLSYKKPCDLKIQVYSKIHSITFVFALMILLQNLNLCSIYE